MRSHRRRIAGGILVNAEPVPARRNSRKAPEHSCQMFLVGEATLQGHFSDARSITAEQCLRALNPQIEDVLVGRDTGSSLEDTHEIFRAATANARHHFQADIAIEVSFYKVSYALHLPIRQLIPLLSGIVGRLVIIDRYETICDRLRDRIDEQRRCWKTLNNRIADRCRERFKDRVPLPQNRREASHQIARRIFLVREQIGAKIDVCGIQRSMKSHITFVASREKEYATFGNVPDDGLS